VGAQEDVVATLAARIDTLERQLDEVRSVQAIERLQRAYGYYLDKALWDDAVALLTDDCSVEIAGRGVYEGPEQAMVLFKDLLGGGRIGLAEGQIYNHMNLQGVTTIGEDIDSARGRWRALIQAGRLGMGAIWAEGVYENTYRREGGVWKIASLHWFATFYSPYQDGWGKTALPMSGVSDVHPPDRPPSIDYEPYPTPFVPPFHYPNPVTGA
jgi:SnoaL-like domain